MDIKLEDFHVSQYLYVLVKRIWLIILCFVLILVFTVYLTYRQTPMFEASASIFTTPGGNPMSGFDGMESVFQTGVSLQTQIHIIKSDPIANMIIDNLNLERRLQAQIGEDSQQFATREDIVAWVKGIIQVTHRSSTSIVTIAAAGEDPSLITDIVNSACDQYIIYSLEGRMDAMRRMLQWHTDQLEDLRRRMKRSKEAMIEFIERERITFFNSQIDVVDGNASGRNILVELRSRRVDLTLDRDRLLQRYTEEHPNVQELQRNIDRISVQIGNEERALTEANKTFIRFGILRAEARADEELYNVFLRKLKEINIADSIPTNNVRVLEYAKVPRAPVSPDKVKNYLLGLLFGIMGGIGMAFVVEYFDDAPKSASEIEAFINLPIIATLPKLKRSKDRSIDLITAKHPKSTEAEVLRMLRTYILFEKDNPEDKVILVTSAGPKEGKSSVVSNLAVSMAQANIRTLLIDADLRRPILHRLYNQEKEVGLTDLLLNRSTLDRVIKKTDIKNLYLMTCGTKVPNPAELLNSQNLKKTILKLRSIFGQILIDTPPTGNLADSLVISSIADSAILVYSGELNKNLLLQTKRMLEKTSVKIYGIVLNNFDTTMKGYYYSYYNKYYNRYYQTYFHEEGDEEQEMI